MDIDFLLKNGLTFDLWHWKFGVYNWTARHFDSDLANIECQPEFQEIEAVADTRGGRRGAQAPPIIFTQALVLKSGSTRKFLF